MKRKMKFVFGKFKIIVILSFLFCIGCQDQDDIIIHDCKSTIIESLELEEYIIAGIDLQESITVFAKELSKVDFSKLETIIDSDGNEVRSLPSFMRSIEIEQKTLVFNTKKAELFKKYPQLISLDLDEFANYVDCCINESVKVNDYFLENSITTYLPLTKSSFGESYDNMNSLVGHLYNWTFSPNYVEVYIVFYKNGSSRVISDSRNTPNNCYISLQRRNGNYYYPTYSSSNEIRSIAHTHRGSSRPSGNDMQVKQSNPGLPVSIFYNGSFHSY